MNCVFSKIMFLVFIIVLLNFVSGFFGMNVIVFFEGSGKFGLFFGIIGVMVVFIFLILVWVCYVKYI